MTLSTGRFPARRFRTKVGHFGLVLGQTQTDQNGEFRFDNVTIGDYDVTRRRRMASNPPFNACRVMSDSVADPAF